MTVWTERQIMAGKAVFEIEELLEPKCEECGFGADRPNCAMGGGCNRHEQDSVIAYRSAIDRLKREGGLNAREFWGWKQDMPPMLLHGVPGETLMNLLLDLEERGGKQETRQHDGRFEWFRARGIVSSSAQDKWCIEITKRGREYLAAMRLGDPSVSPSLILEGM